MARRLVVIGGDAAGMSGAAQARRMASAGELEIVAVTLLTMSVDSTIAATALVLTEPHGRRKVS